MKARNILQCLERGNITDIINSIDNDKEYKEYRAAHPLPDPSTLTREEKINSLIDKLLKLADLEQLREYKALDKLLSYQCTSPELDTFYNNYIKRKQAAGEDPCLLIMNIFNYGIICGKRAERARRKGGAVND